MGINNPFLLTKLWRLPHAAQKIGSKRNIFIKPGLFFYGRFNAGNPHQLGAGCKNLSAAGAVAKGVTGFFFMLASATSL